MRTPVNIVYLHSHDTGRHISPYGHAVSTPAYQRLAEQGMVFRQAFCAGPTCSPSRAALLTGQCAHSAGMIGLAHIGCTLRDPSEHLAAFLARAGYETVLGGVQHCCLDADIPRCGYTKNLRRPHLAQNDSIAAEYIRSRPSKPFFLDIGFIETHRPFIEGKEDPRYCRPPPTVADTAATRQDMADYKASLSVLDQKAGTVLDAIDAAGLAENTLVIATTDHGIAFPGMKCNLTVHGTGVLLLMRGPGGFTGGRVSDALVSHIDLFPTICELLGLEKPSWLQGRSLLPHVSGQQAEIRDEVHSEVTYHVCYEPMRSVRTKRFNYIRRFGGRSTPVLANTDDSPSKSLWLDAGWAQRANAAEELYDTLHDPSEASNRAGDPAFSAALKEMRGRLDRWMKETNDPLLNGPVKLPSGAKYLLPDAVSPSEKFLTAE